MTIKINSPKIGLFTDIHWGKSRDNVRKLNIASDYIDFLISNLKEKKVSTVFFLGDYHDHRNSVNVNTLNHAHNAIKKLCSEFQVFMILGNHDTYFKHTVDVNSINQYEDIKNLTIVSKAVEVDCCGSKMLLCPWHWNIDKYREKEYDFLFGHFEPNGATLFGNVMSSGRYSIKDLCEVGKTVFGGHYHIRKEYPQKKGMFITIGCPFPLDWGDYQNTKGHYILNVLENDLEFVENTDSPIYYKYFWSRLKNGTQELEKEKIKNNYIKLVIDDKYSYKDIMSIMEAIHLCKPITAEPDFVFSINQDLLGEIEFDKVTKLKYTKIEYIIKYIEKMNEEEGMIESIDRQTLIDLAVEYYNQCQTV